MRKGAKADRVFMTPTEARGAAEALDRFLIKYIRLATDAHNDRLVFFNITPKAHYLDHVRLDLRKQLVSQQRILNPMAFSTAMAEDYVGRTSVISRTTHQTAMPLRTAQKWLIETRLRWRGER